MKSTDEYTESPATVPMLMPVAALTNRTVRWTTCALSGQPLAPPIAADWLGSMFNRAAVLEFLLGRAAVFADAAAQVLFS